MASSSSEGNHNVINLNVVPSVALEVWRPYFLSPNGPVTRLFKDNRKKVGELKEKNKGLKILVDSYANDLVARSTKQSKTTTKLQKQYERLLVEVKELASYPIP
uniref:Uncharacterized protein n=1 Tax=Fagus sylvatica TaxID=28930 RepID=A0A2N9IVC6_FAGSY